MDTLRVDVRIMDQRQTVMSEDGCEALFIPGGACISSPRLFLCGSHAQQWGALRT